MSVNGGAVGVINLGLEINRSLFNKQLTGLANNSQSIVKNAFKPIGNIIGGALTVGAITTFTKSCLELGSNLQEVQNVVDVTFGDMAAKVDEFASIAIDKFGLSETVAKKMMGTYGSMSKSFGFNPKEVYDMSAAITGLTADVASFYNLSTDEAYTKMKSIWTGETESLKELGVVMTQTALDQYALNNGFGRTTVSMTEQEKVMLRYMFVQSQLASASGDFARTQDGWANQTRVLTLRFEQLKATLGQGFINLFTPIVKMLNTFIAGLQKAANAFLRLTEIITGKELGSMGNVAVDVDNVSESAGSASENIANMGDSAASAAKKAQRALMGFDQIQKISETSSSGGSSSSGGVSSAGTGAIASEFTKANEEATKLEKTLTEMVDKVNNAWKTGDFTEIGSLIAGKIADGLDAISWDKIKPTAEKIGKSCATFLNGVFSADDMFSEVGETIAEGVNTAVNFAFGFADNFDFRQAGSAIATAINSGFETFDAEKLASTGSKIASGMLNSVIGFIETLDTRTLGTKFGEFLKGIEWENILGDVGELIGKAIVASISFAGATFKEAPLETFLIASIATLSFTGLGSALASKIMTSLTSAFTASSFGAAATSILTTIKTTLAAGASSIWTTFSAAMTVDIATVFGAGTLAEIGVAIFSGVVGAIAAAVGGWTLGNWLYDNNVLCIGDASDKIVEKSGLGDLAVKIADFFEFEVPELKVKLEGKIDESFTNAKATWDEVKENGKQLIAEANGKIQATFTDMKSKWDSLKNDTVTKIANAKEGVQGALAKIRGNWDAIKSKDPLLKALVENKNASTLEKIKIGWKTIKQKTSKLTAKFSDKTGNVFSKVKKMWDGFYNRTTTLTAKFNDFFSAPLKKAWNAIANSINKGINVLNKVPGINITKVPTFATGGFPEEGPFFMNRGEIAGKFSNGKGVVANNQQITTGIANAVGPSVFQAVKGAMAISLPKFHTPQLSVASSGSSEERLMQRMLDALTILASCDANAEMISTLKEVLLFLKTMDRDVYMDGEKVTRIIEDIINRHTEITGQCPIHV